MRVAAESAGDLQREQDYRVRILSTLQRALELHLPRKWADGRDGTIDGVFAREAGVRRPCVVVLRNSCVV